MARSLSLLLTLLGALIAAPVSAQSLAMITMPVVFVSKPVVQPIETQASAPQPAATIVAPPTARQAGASYTVPGYAGADYALPRRVAPQYGRAPQPVWQGPAAVDRRFRDYDRALAQYGPFRVIDARRVALVGETDIASPRHFRAMLRDFPGLRQLDMIECPGTYDDRANMALGRMIRDAGMVTHVPAIGSVRSGAVELFLAGVERDIAEGAEFAVHSWMDEYGREAADFAADAPENRQYLDYYREMGMSDGAARRFYALTNSVPHARALWLDAGDMRRWTGDSAKPAPQRDRRPAPRLAYASIS